MATPIITSVNPLKENITYVKTVKSSKFYSSKLLNYVESVEIDGKLKTVFYSESTTNFNIGDRVFVVNGNYDSNDLIAEDKYSRNIDGYKILGVDGCRIILDLDYTGVPPSNASIDNSIKVYHITSQREFDYINSIKVISPSVVVTNNAGVPLGGLQGPAFISKFEGRLYNLDGGLTSSIVLFSDSLIYVDNSYTGSSDPLISNQGVSQGRGYYVFISQTNTWVNVTTQVELGKIKEFSSIYNLDGNLYVVGEDIEDKYFLGITLKQRNFYKYSGGKWVVDNLSKQPFISKLNFRSGKFTGTHNDGIFGTTFKRNKWSAAGWNSGVFINSTWQSGAMNSKSKPGEKLFKAVLETQSDGSERPVQSVDLSNNRGFGANYVSDTNFEGGNFFNGIFENCNFGINSTISAVDVYLGLTHSWSTSIQGELRLCNVRSSQIINSNLINTVVTNTNISDSKITNSQVINSSIESSQITDDSGIRIIAADVWSYHVPNPAPGTSDIRGILKLYINDRDIDKLIFGDAFYISKSNKDAILSKIDENGRVLLPFETKYILDYYFNKELSPETISVSYKTSTDNTYKCLAEKTNQYNTIFSVNDKNYASIDIDLQNFGYYKSQSEYSATGFLQLLFFESLEKGPFNLISKVFTNTFLSNLDIKSGIIEKSEWLSGCNINYYPHRVLNGLNNDFQIQTINNNTIQIVADLDARMNPAIRILGEDLFLDDNVWLNSFSVNGIQIDGRYRVVGILGNAVLLQNLDGLTIPNGQFIINGARTATNASIHKLLINNSTISSGLFQRTGFRNSTFTNELFDNNDRTIRLDNTNRLRIIQTVFKNTNNTISSGVIHKSHFVDDNWSNGLLFNSIWNGGIFKKGTAKRVAWQSGTFENGAFIDSFNIFTLPVDYDLNNQYYNWLSGTFNLGEFINSVWINGVFNNGSFVKSNWYSGIWNNGVLGDKNNPQTTTKFATDSPLPYSGTMSMWYNGVVENATIGGSGSVYWYDGKFNNGVFTSFGVGPTIQSIWYGGDFNGGKFSELAKWKNGRFYGGKFESILGYNLVSPTNPSTNAADYGWENGTFFGGEFGNATLGTNSVWFTGEFKGGIFIGKFWYSGIFTKGVFLGSGSASIYNSPNSTQDEFDFANSFTQSYYGLWWSGIVSNRPQNVKTNEPVSTIQVRKIEERPEDNTTLFQNMLWLNGTFSHDEATFYKSLWLKGKFENGTFDSSIFNPYVDRDFTGVLTNSSFESTTDCVWMNGVFDSSGGTGSFYHAEWNDGVFNKGYMAGGFWRNGTWNYGSADNVFWQNGLWRNGNWNGSPFNYLDLGTVSGVQYAVKPGRSRDLMYYIYSKRLAEYNLVQDNWFHINNGFSASAASEILQDNLLFSLNAPNSSWISGNNETYSGIAYYTGYLAPNNTIGLVPVYDDLDKSIWGFSTTYSLDGNIITNNTNIYTTGGENQAINPINAQTGYNSNNPSYFNPPQSDKLYAQISGSQSIFTTPGETYEISLTIGVELAPSATLEFVLGQNSPITVTINSRSEVIGTTQNYWLKFYNIKLIYTTPTTFTSHLQKEFYFRKTSDGIVRMSESYIYTRRTEYHPTWNNIWWDGINADKTILFPPDSTFSPVGTSDTGNLVSVNFGNGVFASGIWENGVWNDGFRSNWWLNRDDYAKFSDVIGINGIDPYNTNNTYQISETRWYVTLQSIDTVAQFVVGDKIAVGNIVAIDLNEKRSLIKDYVNVVLVNTQDNTITFEYLSSIPLRRIIRDSENHLIYVTKNIWLSGAFLNGQFRGVFNNGLIKGYPMITRMLDTHLVTGKFDGGRFISQDDNPAALNYNTYPSGLVQQFEFIDNNTSGEVEGGNDFWRRYVSWMDIKFLSNSYTSNLNQPVDIFTVENEFGVTWSYFKNAPNLKGGITYDILESTSTFRNSFSLDSTVYNLGTKYTTFENFAVDDGKFLKPVTNREYAGIQPQQLRGNRRALGLESFYEDGWTFSNLGSLVTGSPNQMIFGTNPGQIQYTVSITASWVPSGEPEIIANLGVDTTNRLNISLTQSAYVNSGNFGVGNFGSFVGYTRFILTNTNVETPPNRYYLLELDLATYSFAPFIIEHPAVIQGNTIGPETDYKMSLGTDINELYSPGLVKRQFFYNTNDFSIELKAFIYQLTTLSNPLTGFTSAQFNLSINEFSMKEVDMVPFFRYYYDVSEIDTRIKIPNTAVAPEIEYDNSNFNFINNIDLKINSDSIVAQNQISFVSAF